MALKFLAEGERLDRAVARFAGVSRTQAKAWIEAGYVRVAGAVVTKPAYRLKGETVVVERPPEPPLRVEPEERALEVLYEDEELIVVNKPPGMLTHPAPGEPGGSLVGALLAYFGHEGIEADRPELVRPGIVHRLDRDTSGAIVVAKTPFAQRKLSAAFKNRFVLKRYLAITQGVPRAMTLVAPIGRHPVHRHKMHVGGVNPRYAETDIAVIAEVSGHALVEARPHTGRTHQIRVHLKHLGAPILSDPLYGRPHPAMPRQALHAYELRLPHPQTGLFLTFVAPVPADMVAAWEAVGGRWPEGFRLGPARASA